MEVAMSDAPRAAHASALAAHASTAVPNANHAEPRPLPESAKLERLADALAPRVAALLLPHLLAALNAPPPVAEPAAPVDAAELARILGVSRAFVYEHAAELGAQRVGPGGVDPATGKRRRPRLRFDVETARAAFLCSGGNASQAPDQPVATDDVARSRARRSGRRRASLPEPGSILAPKAPAGRRAA
jgi:hypothetical protein